jgi:hypothetical protein
MATVLTILLTIIAVDTVILLTLLLLEIDSLPAWLRGWRAPLAEQRKPDAAHTAKHYHRLRRAMLQS